MVMRALKDKDDSSRRTADVVLDIGMAVDELHSLSAREMKKLLRDSHNFTLRLGTGRGAFLRVDMERLASCLPLHLLACVASSISEPRFRYLLRGIRLLHSLGDLAPRYPKLEQILLQEVKIREQIIDLVIFLLIVLADVEQDGRLGSFLALHHSALVACCLHLLTAFVTPEWRDVVPVLLAHPKVDVFMDAAFDAVKRDVGLLQGKLRSLNTKIVREKTPLAAAERVAQTTLQQCEASLQVLAALSDPQAFRDRILNHKELCKSGGILRLVLSVLRLHLPSHFQDSRSLTAAISRLKSKALAMLLKFCETESISFLDEVAMDPRSMQIAETIALEVVFLLKATFLEKPLPSQVFRDSDRHPRGSLSIHSMRLADVLSDDSNFRSFFMDRIAPDLGMVLAMEPIEFGARWCGGQLAKDLADAETDALLIYDPFHAAGAAMQPSKTSGTASIASSQTSEEARTGCSLSVKPMQPDIYVQETSALLVKLFANLHCFNPEVCSADEKDRFIQTFVHHLTIGPFSPNSSSFFLTEAQTAVRICENLNKLVEHVASFSVEVVNDEDIELVSDFSRELHETICTVTDPDMEPPVIGYVRDAHNYRLKTIFSRRKQSERWQRMQEPALFCERGPDTALLQASVGQSQEVSTIPQAEEASSAVENRQVGSEIKLELQEDERNQETPIQELPMKEAVEEAGAKILGRVAHVDYRDDRRLDEGDDGWASTTYPGELGRVAHIDYRDDRRLDGDDGWASTTYAGEHKSEYGENEDQQPNKRPRVGVVENEQVEMRHYPQSTQQWTEMLNKVVEQPQTTLNSHDPATLNGQ